MIVEYTRYKIDEQRRGTFEKDYRKQQNLSKLPAIVWRTSCPTVQNIQPITFCELSGTPKRALEAVSDQRRIQIILRFGAALCEAHRRNAPLSGVFSGQEKRRVAVFRASVMDCMNRAAGIFAHSSTDLHKCSIRI